MGYYTDISKSEYAAKDTALYNRLNGVSGHTVAGVIATQLAPQLLQFTIGKILSGSDKTENETNTSNSSEQTKREELQKKLDEALKEIGADNENQINEAVSKVQDERDKKVGEAQTAVNTFIDGTDKYSSQITELKGKLVTSQNGVELTAEEKAQNDKINKEIEKLEAKRQEAYEKAVADLEEVTKTEDAKVETTYKKAQEAIDLVEQLAKLNHVGDEEVKVEEKTEALADFTKYRKLFTDTKASTEERIEYGAELKKIAEANPNDKTIQNAYKMLESKIEALSWSEMHKNNPQGLGLNQKSFGI